MKKILFILLLIFTIFWFLSINYLDFYFLYNSIDFLDSSLITFIVKIFYLSVILLWIYYFLKNNFLKQHFKYILVILLVFILFFVYWFNDFSKINFLKYDLNNHCINSQENTNNDLFKKYNYKYNFSSNFSNLFFDINEYNYFSYIFIKNNAWEIKNFFNYKISFIDTLLSKEKLYLKKLIYIKK